MGAQRRELEDPMAGRRVLGSLLCREHQDLIDRASRRGRERTLAKCAVYHKHRRRLDSERARQVNRELLHFFFLLWLITLLRHH